MNRLRQWVSLLTSYIDICVMLLVSRNNLITSSYLGKVFRPWVFRCMAGKMYGQLERAMLIGILRISKLDLMLDTAMQWLNDVFVYGRPVSLQQCRTYNTLRYHGVFSEKELRSAVRSNFIHGDGYIDIDFVCLTQMSRASVVMLSVLALTVPAVLLSSELTSPTYLSSLSTELLLFAILPLVVIFLLTTSISLLVMYRVYLSGIVPLAVAQAIYEKRVVIQKLGPRCVFVINASARCSS